MTDELKIRENSDWYYANLSSLLPKYQGRYVAVADKALFGDYGECVEGVRALESAGFPRGTFIVHKCVPLEQERREWYFRTNRIKTQIGGAMKFTFRIPSEGDKPFVKEVA